MNKLNVVKSENILDNNTLKEMLEYFEYCLLEDGKVKLSRQLSLNSRRSKIRMFNRKTNILIEKKILEIINTVLIEANNHYNFNIDIESTVVQLTQYNSSDSGYYIQHQDSPFLFRNKDRKLSTSLLVKKADVGGNFLLEKMYIPTKVGQALSFPSFFNHEVTPVEEGQRISIVGWVDGPEWR